MSLHRSLKRVEKITAIRTVFGRVERVKMLKEKGQWDENSKVIGLPKTKITRVKISKKEKAQEAQQAQAQVTADQTQATSQASATEKTQKESKK